MPMTFFAAGLAGLLHAMQRPVRAWVRMRAPWPGLLWAALLGLLPPPGLAAGPGSGAAAAGNAATTTTTTSTATPEKRIALVIGNARYPAIPLNNPENDARVVASTLRRLGFEVQEHVNLPVKRFRQVLREHVRRLQNETGVGLFYYAGHGVQIDGKNYLLPVDINLRDEEEIKDEAVDIDDLFMSKLARAKTKGLIVVLDACRDNPFRGKTRNVQAAGGLAEMGAPGAFIAYSAAPGATAEDGPENTNSVFTRHLAYEMLQPGQEIETTFKNVRVKVLRDTQKRQMPWTNSSLTIDFQFNAQAAGAAARAEAERQARIKSLQDLLDKREAEQRQLEAQLQAMQRELQQRQAAGAAGPVLVPAPVTQGTALPTAADAGPGTPMPPGPTRPTGPSPGPVPAPAPGAYADTTPPTTTTPTTTPRREPAPAPATSPTGTAGTAPAPAPGPGASPGPSAGPAPGPPTGPTSKGPTTAAGRAPAGAAGAAGKRPYTERCVELQVRASLGEPVSVADIQRECRQ